MWMRHETAPAADGESETLGDVLAFGNSLADAGLSAGPDGEDEDNDDDFEDDDLEDDDVDDDDVSDDEDEEVEEAAEEQH
jgi:hypothetical protein